MKFRIHIFREFREEYEVEAKDAEAAVKVVDANLADLTPVRTETHSCLKKQLNVW